MLPIILRVTPWRLSVCRLDVPSVPAWATQSAFLCFTKTPDEYSLVCESAYVPAEVKAEAGWSCMKVEGVLDFSLVGVIAGITQVLASAKISVFVVSTHDTDYVLVKSDMLEQAVGSLHSHGYGFA